MESDQTVSLCVWLHAALEVFPSNVLPTISAKPHTR